MNTDQLLIWGLRLAGVGQIFIAGIYFWVREIVGWSADLDKLHPVNRSIAHTYSRYIQALNLAFGLVCLFQPHELLNQTALAADLTLIIGLYWFVRFILSVVYYDYREITSQKPLYRLGLHAFNALFAGQGTVLLVAFAHNLEWIAA